MKIFIHLLFIGGLSILIGEATNPSNIMYAINDYFVSGGQDLGVLRGINLRLIPEKKLGESAHSVVWQGLYKDHINVAVKIYWSEDLMKREMNVYKALNATKNPAIEQMGIPKVHYAGPILADYDAIALTLFDGTLENYYNHHKQSGKLPDLTMLQIFGQTITTMEYLHRMDYVVHNDIKPENIFFLGEKVFIGGFDLATTKGQKNEGHTLGFASAKFFSFNLFAKRHPMDDLESLVYSMWHISGVPLGKWTWLFGTGIPEGYLLSRCNKQEAIDRVMEKLAHFKNPSVYKAMKYICVDEMLSGRPVPNYGQIITEIHQAIADYK